MASAVATPVANGADRRKSGRASHRPPIFSQENHYGSVLESAKRKRQSDVAPNNEDDEMEDVPSESEEESSEEGEPDEEELREKRRKQRSKNTVSKPAAKRPKTTTGASTTLAIRSANAPKKTVTKAAKQKARSRPSQFQTTGLYADVFGKGLDAESAATSWHNELEGDHVAGIRDVVNLLLQVIGCESQIESSDIEDFDNVSGKLGDILAEYDNQKEPDYPLSGKQKQFHGMKEVFIDFFKAIVHALHNSSLLYEEPAIYDNLFIWIATSTGAGHRAFRITATLANLAMMTGLTEAAKDIRAGMAASKQQLDAEKKKRSSNKGRIAKLQEEMTRDEKRVRWLDDQLKDSFDTVFAHRYRDVDEKIRVECAKALGEWILNYRFLFLEGQYLRYLGWVLSDPHAATRLEVVRQLKLIYKPKTNVGALRGFTDRFRARLVEMGARDADVTVRVDTIELLDRLRSRELLEPEDIDTVGHLIFDNEPRVRKAVANFFVSNIEDLYEASIEDLDETEFNEALPDEQQTENYDQPTKLWIKFKCLAQILGAQTKSSTSKRNKSIEFSGIENVESRYTVATLSIFDSMPELQHWEALAGCLLYDHSGSADQADASNTNAAIKQTYRLEGSEEVILLDVLINAVKLSLQQVVETRSDDKNKRTKKTKDDLRKQQESTAHNLSVIIPQLHSKFGSTPQAAKAILKLHQLFDPNLVDDVREGDDDQAVLLDDVNKEFTTHSDAQVLAEASRALRTALAHENSKEAAEKKISELWNDLVLWTLSKLLTGQKASERGVLDRDQLQQLAEVTGRLSQLAKVKDCCESLESRMQWIAGNKANRKRTETLLEIILQLVLRGQPDEDTPPEPAALEDQISRFAITILGFYFRWKVYNVKRAIKDNDDSVLTIENLTAVARNKADFTNALLPMIAARKPLDSVRVAAIKALTDLYVLFATVRYDEPDEGDLDSEIQTNIQNLITKLDNDALTAIMETHEKMEKRLARKTNRKNLEFPIEKAKKSRSDRGSTSRPGTANGRPAAEEEEQVDRPPEDSDDEEAAASDAGSDASSSDGDDQEVEPDSSAGESKGASAKEAKQKAAFLAEKALCDITAKIVYVVLGDVVSDKDGIKKRLQVNRTKLGKNYTQTVAYLDDKKDKASKSKKGARESVAPKTPVKGATAATTATSAKGNGVSTAQGGKKGAKEMISEAMVLSDDDIEDDDDDDNEEEEGDQREQGLEDDPIDEDDDDEREKARGDNVPDDDEIMGD